jgi:GNAT superfamily N-acetyltransferase
MPISIRPAQRDDSDAVKHMLGEFVEYLDAIEPSEGEADLDYLIDQAFGPNPVCKTLIAERDGQPVGYVSFHPGIWEIWRSVYVISLFVRAEARGTGAGRALMDAVKDVARTQAAKRIVWEVWSKNPLAIDFYKSIGGEVFEENLRMSLVVE